MTDDQIVVRVQSYDDRGDPAPPKNWRAEILVKGKRWIPLDEAEFRTEAEAKKHAAYVRRIITWMVKKKVEDAVDLHDAKGALADPTRVPLEEVKKYLNGPKFKAGDRIQTKEGWDKAGQQGRVLSDPVFVEQFWVPILWDTEDDPDFAKARSLEHVSVVDAVGRMGRTKHRRPCPNKCDSEGMLHGGTCAACGGKGWVPA